MRFRDDEYPDLARDALYYARAVEAARPGILGAGLSTQFDADGNATSIELCGTFDDCTGPVEERAWSSPIFVNHAGSQVRFPARDEPALARLRRAPR